MPPKPVDISFPVKGLDQNWAFKAQPEGTSPDLLNVRPYDVLGQRLRGGQRGGTSKYISTQPNGAVPIQMLLQEPRASVGFIEDFTAADGASFDSFPAPWIHYDWTGPPWFSGSSGAPHPTIQNNALEVTDASVPSAHVYNKPSLTGDMTVGFTVTNTGGVDDSCNLGLLIRVNGSGNPGYVVYYFAATTSGTPIVQVNDETGATVAFALIGGYPQPWASGGAAPGQTTQFSPVRVSASTEGAILKVYLNGVLVVQVPGVVNSSQKLGGFVIADAQTAGSTFSIDDFSVSSSAVTTGTSSRILTCSGGDVYSGIAGGGWSTVGTGMNTTGPVRGQIAFGKAYLVDGLAAHYSVYDPTTQALTAWSASAGTLPHGASDTSIGATIIALYRGRVVLSGISDDPQNWFMSAAGNPKDWGYGATPSATMAVAGNNSVAGLVGDRVTCLAPSNDDLMVIGGDHTLWMMRGDPANGGSIDNISNQIGIVGPDAFAFDPHSVLYFFGNGVLWRLTTDGQISPLSRGRLDKAFGAIDFSTHTMRLLWNDILHGLHIFVTPNVSGTTTHYWWDVRTDSFWKDQYPDNHGPTATMFFNSDALNDRAVLLGGQDGYLRQVDASKNTDDGTTILSRIKFGPTMADGVQQNTRLNRIVTVLDQDSDPVAVRLYAAESPEEVVKLASPLWSYMASPVDRYSIPRIGGNALLVEIKNDSFSETWLTATDYAIGDQVVEAGVPYICAEAHTSDVFATDLADDLWVASDFRTWSLESMSLTLDVTGRTRHRRI